MLGTIILAYIITGILITMTLGDIFNSVYIDWKNLWFDALLFIFAVITAPALSLIFIIQGIIEKIHGRL